MSPGASVCVRSTIRYSGGEIWFAGLLVVVVVSTVTVVDVSILDGGAGGSVVEVEPASTVPEPEQAAAIRPPATNSDNRDVRTTGPW